MAQCLCPSVVMCCCRAAPLNFAVVDRCNPQLEDGIAPFCGVHAVTQCNPRRAQQFRCAELCSRTGVSSGARGRGGAQQKRGCAYSCGVESMRALTVAPGIADSAGVDDVPGPPESDGAVLVRTLALR